MTTCVAPVPLNASHELKDFCSGNRGLDEWLTKRALHNQATGASRVFVTSDESNRVIGYYSLSTGSIARSEIPRASRHGAPQPIPILLIGRFAVDREFQGLGLGRSLLQDALERCARILDDVAFMFILVHPVDEAAAGFWQHYGFIAAPTIEPMLLLPLNQLRTAN
jgi:GNAT superfamily N-acetyltransferase